MNILILILIYIGMHQNLLATHIYFCNEIDKEMAGTIASKTNFFTQKEEKINLLQLRGKIVLLEFLVPIVPEHSNHAKYISKLIDIIEQQEEDGIIVMPIFLFSTNNFMHVKKTSENFISNGGLNIKEYYIDMNNNLISSILTKKQKLKLPFSMLIAANGKEVGRLNGSLSEKIMKEKINNPSLIIKSIKECATSNK